MQYMGHTPVAKPATAPTKIRARINKIELNMCYTLIFFNGSQFKNSLEKKFLEFFGKKTCQKMFDKNR